MSNSHFIVINIKTRTIKGVYMDYQIALGVAKSLGNDWAVEEHGFK